MKRVFVVIAVVMVLTLALGAVTASAQGMGMPGMPNPFYWVKPGDTLSQIAWMHGTSVWAIAQANGIMNPNLIFVGQRLYIPTMPGPGPMPGPMPGPFGASYNGGYSSWSNSGYVSWGGGYPYWGGGCGGFQPMPFLGGQQQVPFGGGGWGDSSQQYPMGGQMSMGASF